MGCKKGVKFHKYTEEEKQFIADNIWMRTSAELTEMFEEKFGIHLQSTSIKAFCSRHKFVSGLDCKFKKGQAPANKGRKQTEFMSAEGMAKSSKTRFKKGNVSPKHRPVGSTRISKDGYIEIKVAEPNKWMTRNRYVYTEAYGEIPKGHVIIHINGDKIDDRIENLTMLSHSELARLNQSKLERGIIDEADRAIINLAKINAEIGRRSKK